MGKDPLDNVVFDFEQHIIEETPLLDERTEHLRKHDKRYKTVVCRHYVNGLCMKGDNCEYAHELDPSRMPECRWGESCRNPDCQYRHTRQEDKSECAFYKQGFCAHGPVCRFRHVTYTRDELPEETDWSVGIADPADATDIARRSVEQNENYKISLCRNWENNGNCTFGDHCHFAHGAEQLRPKVHRDGGGFNQNSDSMRQPSSNTPSNFNHQMSTNTVHSGGKVVGVELTPTPLDQRVAELQNAEDTILDPYSDRGRGLTLPHTLPNGSAPGVRYFVMRSSSIMSLAASLKQKQWSVRPEVQNKLNEAFDSSRMVIFIFTADGMPNFFGCAQMVSHVLPQENDPIVSLPAEAQGWSYCCGVDWFRTCELPYTRAGNLAALVPELKRPLPIGLAFESQELPPMVGHAAVIMLFRQAEQKIDLSQVSDDIKLEVHPLGPDPALDPMIQESEQIRNTRAAAMGQGGITDVPVAPGSVAVKGPAFVFSASNGSLKDEMFGRNLFGAPAAAIESMKFIQAGTLLVLHSTNDHVYHGVFEATSAAQLNLDPSAFPARFGRRPEDGPVSMLPAQVSFRPLMRAAPLPEAIIPTDVLPRAGSLVRVEPVEMQKLANLFAVESGLDARAQPSAMMLSASTQAATESVPPGITVGELEQLPDGKFAIAVTINIPFDPRFKAANRIIGKSGINMKKISTETGARTRVEAVDKTVSSKEIVGPFEVVVTTDSEPQCRRAAEIAKSIIDETVAQHEEFAERFHRPQPRMPPPQHWNGPPRGPPGMMNGPPRGFMPPRGHPPPRGMHRDNNRGPPPDGRFGGGPRGPPRGPPQMNREISNSGRDSNGPPRGHPQQHQNIEKHEFTQNNNQREGGSQHGNNERGSSQGGGGRDAKQGGFRDSNSRGRNRDSFRDDRRDHGNRRRSRDRGRDDRFRSRHRSR